MIRILLLDDHPVVRHGTRSLIETQPDLAVVSDTGNATEAAHQCHTETVDVALVDLDLGSGQPTGAEATQLIHHSNPGTRVIAFTAFDADTDIVRMIDAGAVGYLLKDAPPTALFAAIRNAANGGTALAAPIRARLEERTQHPTVSLTARELEVLECAAAGLPNRELAQRLMVSEATVKTHLHHIYTKLGAENRQTAVAVAVRDGLIRLER